MFHVSVSFFCDDNDIAALSCTIESALSCGDSFEDNFFYYDEGDKSHISSRRRNQIEHERLFG